MLDMACTLLLALCVLVTGVNMKGPDPIKIGVILDEKTSHQYVLSFAWKHFDLGGKAKHDETRIDVSDSHRLITDMCLKMEEEIFMLIVENNPLTYKTVQSYVHNMGMPTLIPAGSGGSSKDGYDYDISLLPPTIDAIVDVIKYFRWNKVIYYVWDANDGLLRLQRLYELFNDTHELLRPVVRARRISNVSDCYDILRKMDHEEPPRRPMRIVLDLSSREAYNSVLQQIVDVGMNRIHYHYILGGLGIDELDLSMFKYGGVNITGFSVIDRASLDNKKLIQKATTHDFYNVGQIRTPEALIIDTVHVLQRVLQVLREEPRSRRQRTGRGVSTSTCSGIQVTPASDGAQILETIKKVKVYGLTGNIEFDEHRGIRKNYVFKVQHLQHKKELQPVGTWTPKGRLNTTLPREEIEIEPTIFPNRTLKVTTIQAEPFVQVRTAMEDNGAPKVDGKHYEGYCIDLAKAIHEVCSTPYDYKIHIVKDGAYGRSYADGSWDGMIGELIRKEADIAIAPLTITEVRQRVVDFTKPFMQTGISIMIKKPDKEKPGVFSFMYPLSNEIWLCVMIAFVTVSLVLFLVGRWSPYEWQDGNIKGESPVNNFTLFNTFWFSLGALMQQGSDIFPRSYSGRVVGSAWWFFTLILISSYTANLAAFLTIERLLPPVDSVDDLVNNPEMDYGTLNTGSSRVFFESSKVPVYSRMWNFMHANEERVLVGTVGEGVEKVRNSKKKKYAFLMESTFNMYFEQRKPCNTMMVGENLDSKSYGLATPVYFYLRKQLNLAVLHLREVGELHKLRQKWWYAKGMCGTDNKDAKTSALTLSNVSGIFHILVAGLVLSMVAALLEYFVHSRTRLAKKKKRTKKFLEYSTPLGASAASPLVTFDSGAANFGTAHTRIH